MEEWQRRTEAESEGAKRTEVITLITITFGIHHLQAGLNVIALKCNSDGVWCKDKESSGLGWICRDTNSRMVWAEARAVTRADSAILAEAEALKWAAETLVSFRYTHIIFESDSQTVVRMINGKEQVWPLPKLIIEAI